MPDKPSPKRPAAKRPAAKRPAEAPSKAPQVTRNVDPKQARKVIKKRTDERAMRQEVIKVPRFPQASKERPRQLMVEERRRIEIAQAEKVRREKLLSETEEPERRERLLEGWRKEDRLFYQHDPADVEMEVYPVKEPWQYVQVFRNTRSHEVFYHAIEPRLTHDEQELLAFIEETLVDVLDLQPSELENDDMESYIRRQFEEVLDDYSVNLKKIVKEPREQEQVKERLLYYVLRDFIGEGPLDILMNDPGIEDISCDGPHQPIFVYHRGHEALTTTIRFRDHDHLDSFVIRMAQRAGKHVSIAEPILDATMRDGSRLQATLAKEVSTFGSTFTIRKFKEVPFTPVDLTRFGTMSAEMLAYLWLVIEYHMSAIYAGGTASGKTTAINALMLFIPPQNKVVTIEDTREIRIPQPNWIAGLTRDGFGPRDEHGRQAGEIDMFQLLKNALRQRPEYIVVGEVRGKEAYSLFQAMATGHAAYGTMHADSVNAVIHRLESDPINIPRSLLEALDVVCVQIQTRVGNKRVRRTKQITEIVGLDPHTREILTNEVFTWEPTEDRFVFSGVSYALERIAAEAGITSNEAHRELRRRVQVIDYMIASELKDYTKVAHLITTYYRDRDRVMAAAEAGTPWD